jgi:uncharacterized membrane protein
MKKLIRPGQVIFATGIIALGVLQFFAKDFIVGRPPAVQWASNIPGKQAWAFVSGIILIIGGLAVILKRSAASVAFFIGIFIFIFSFLCRHLPHLFTVASAQDVIWQINAYKTFGLCGGAFIIAASFHGQSNTLQVRLSCILLALFFIISGFAHFKFDNFIINGFIPAYIPFHPFWTYFCGIALIAGGVGLLVKQTREWAAALTGLMILLWFFLLHIPRASHAPHDYAEWMGVCESFTFSGILFTLAGLSSRSNLPGKN